MAMPAIAAGRESRRAWRRRPQSRWRIDKRSAVMQGFGRRVRREARTMVSEVD